MTVAVSLPMGEKLETLNPFAVHSARAAAPVNPTSFGTMRHVGGGGGGVSDPTLTVVFAGRQSPGSDTGLVTWFWTTSVSLPVTGTKIPAGNAALHVMRAAATVWPTRSGTM